MGGMLQGLTQAVGEALTDFCGARMTRLTAKAEAGDLSVSVERAYGWGQTGQVQIDGTVYLYGSRTDSTLSDLSCQAVSGTLIGIQEAHALGAPVLDVSRTSSALDQLRAGVFVGTAVGEDLDVLGRNLGVPRDPSVTDDAHYRQIIEAVAYSPRGTLYALELALNAMVGAGNYQIQEGFPGSLNTVQVSLSAQTFLSQQAQGHTYLDGRTALVAASATQPTLPEAFLSVTSLQLADEAFWLDCRSALPSTGTDSASGDSAPLFTFGADPSQAKLVQMGPSAGGTQIQACPAYYTRAANLQPETTARAGCIFAIPTNATLGSRDARSFGMRLCDGAYAVGFGVVGRGGKVGFGLCDARANGSGAFLTDAVGWFERGEVVEISLEKVGRHTVVLRLGNAVVQTAQIDAFPQTTQVAFDVGCFGGTNALGIIRFVGLTAHTPTEYLGSQGYMTATVDPQGLSDPAGLFAPQDTGRPVRLSGGTALNDAGGTNNGVYVARYVSPTKLGLSGPVHAAAAQVSQGTSGQVYLVGTHGALTYPDDLGKTLVLSGSAAGNDGAYTVTAILQDGTHIDFADYESPIQACSHTCVVAGAEFTAEAGLTWQLNPDLVAETGLTYDLSGTAEVAVSDADTQLTLRQPLPLPQVAYSAQATRVYTGQVLDSDVPCVVQTSEGPPITFNYAPAYAAEPSNYIHVYLQDLLAAGTALQLTYT